MALGDLSKRIRNFIFACDIKNHGFNIHPAGAPLVSQFVNTRLQIAGDDFGAGCGKATRQSAANAASRTRDQDQLTLK
jgi:hypothetical protein